MGTSSICNFIIRSYVYTAGHLVYFEKFCGGLLSIKHGERANDTLKDTPEKSSSMITQAAISVLSIPYTTVYPIVGENRTCGIVKHNICIY